MPERHRARLGRLHAASSRAMLARPDAARRGVAAAALPDLGAAEPGPGGASLSRRPLRRPRLRALEQRLVLGPLPALLQRPVPAARRPARPAADRRAGGGRCRGARSRCSPAAASATRRYSGALVRRRGRRLAADRAHHVPARGPVRPRRRCSPPIAAGSGSPAAGRAGQPREPGGRPVRRARRVPLSDRRRAPRGASRWRSAACSRSPRSTSPSRSAGSEPFVFSAFIAVPLLAAVVLWLVPRGVPGAADRRRPLRARSRSSSSCLDTPLGGNVTRLGRAVRRAGARPRALAAWPLGGDRRLAPAALLAADRPGARRPQGGRRSVDRAGVLRAALVDELDTSRRPGPFRVEIPPTKNRWEADYVAREHPLARGWLRQLESDDFDLFTDGELTPETYRGWLDDHAVSYVAVSDSPHDYLAEDEVPLIDSGLDYLRPVWGNGDWRLYRVAGAEPPGVDELGVDWSAARPAPRDLRAIDQRQPLVESDLRRRLRGRARRAHRRRGLAPWPIRVAPALSRGRC